MKVFLTFPLDPIRKNEMEEEMEMADRAQAQCFRIVYDHQCMAAD
jgi:hypothetical protein